jgi:hypothetical protein
MLAHFLPQGLLTWLDASPARFAVASWTVFGLAVASALGAALPQSTKRWWQSPYAFAALSMLSILAFRWPMIMDNRELQDPDESQMMSGALKLAHDPFYWKSVDGDTRGPIDDLPLLALKSLERHLDYTGVRVFSAVLAWSCVMCGWLVLRRFFGDGCARVLILPLLGVHAFADFWNFVQYGSEQVADALVALSCALLVGSFPRSEKTAYPFRLLLVGVTLGLVPFAKLQAVPVAFWIGVYAMWQIAVTCRTNFPLRIRCYSALVGGVLSVFAAILVWVTCGGAWRDFYESYIVDNFRYAGAPWFPWTRTLSKLYELIGMAPGSTPFLASLLVLSVLGFVAYRLFDRAYRRYALFTLGLTLSAGFAVIAPGRLFPHYLQLAFFPLSILGGLVAGAAWSMVGERYADRPALARSLQVTIAAIFLAIGLGPQVAWRSRESQPSLGRYTETQGALQETDVSEAILSHSRTGESLGIWGWSPKFWVQTGLIQATRDGETSRQQSLTTSRNRYRDRYMNDLMQSRPPVFIDAVGMGNFGFHDRLDDGHETFRDLNDYIRVNYRQVGDVDGTRIYVRNDRS